MCQAAAGKFPTTRPEALQIQPCQLSVDKFPCIVPCQMRDPSGMMEAEKEDMPMEWNDRLAAARKAAGLSQEQLGERLDVTRQAVSKWESGQATPDVLTAARLCEVLQISADYLLLVPAWGYLLGCGLFWEYVTPLYLPRSVSDPWDILAVWLGGTVMLVLLRRPRWTRPSANK